MALRLDDDAIEQCVAVCDEMLDSIRTSMIAARKIDKVSGFGGFRIGQQLTAGYTAKAEQVRERLGQYETVILAMREAFASGGEAFADTDGNFARAMADFERGGTE
ncbi:MAG: hypothetical protein GX610_14345 [Rhodococcus sp.]|nr:hypothetical protein [Rhodococcus sp. (in: high G+C Gram-positive bacteria)]